MHVHQIRDQWLFAPSDGAARAIDVAALGPAITLVVPQREAPLDVCREEPDVDTFAIHADVIGSIFPGEASFGEVTAATMLARALALPDVPPIAVLEPQGGDRQVQARAPSPSVAVILPHLGSVSDLRRCARSIRPELRHESDELLIGLDHDETLQPGDVTGIEARMFRVQGERVGPYRIRNQLAEHATSPVLAFQDSDDLPIAGRFAALAAALDGEGPDWIGTHELRLDPTAGRLTPVRYPLDVNAALDTRPRQALLLPTSAIKAATFRSLGGFSDDAIHSLDTEFMLRAHLQGARIANLDRFLYLRVVRRDSLTMSAATGYASAERRSLLHQWLRDFAEVHAGRLALADSSLALRRVAPAPFVELDHGSESEIHRP